MDIFKARVPAMLLGTAMLVLLGSVLDVGDIKKLDIDPRSPVSWFGLGISFALCLAAAIVWLVENGRFPDLLSKTRKVPEGISAKMRQTEITIAFGRLEQIAPVHPAHREVGVALPTNDFFDDDCLAAQNTACGAYANARFPRDISKLAAELSLAASSLPVLEHAEREAGKFADSFGAGKCVVLVNPAGNSPTILFTSVSIKRARYGIRSDLGYLDAGIECILHQANDHRLKQIYLPIFGSGEGGLSHVESLSAMLASISVNLRRQTAQSVVAITLVVFQRDEKSRPVVSKRAARKLLDHAIRVHDQSLR